MKFDRIFFEFLKFDQIFSFFFFILLFFGGRSAGRSRLTFDFVISDHGFKRMTTAMALTIVFDTSAVWNG